MSTRDLGPARSSGPLSRWLPNRVDILTRFALRIAVRKAPPSLRERLQEEWAADILERRGPLDRLQFACGCYWAAIHIRSDGAVAAAAVSPMTATRVHTGARRRDPTRRLRLTASTEGTPVCAMNTTPLIDVLLVLLVTLILSLPIMTHAVKLDLPINPSTQEQVRPAVIDLDIDYDGTVAWNGAPVATLSQLESYFRNESLKSPQPEVHLRPDSHVKYDAVARVLAAAQRNGMSRLGFVNSADFMN